MIKGWLVLEDESTRSDRPIKPIEVMRILQETYEYARSTMTTKDSNGKDHPVFTNMHVWMWHHLIFRQRNVVCFFTGVERGGGGQWLYCLCYQPTHISLFKTMKVKYQNKMLPSGNEDMYYYQTLMDLMLNLKNEDIVKILSQLSVASTTLVVNLMVWLHSRQCWNDRTFYKVGACWSKLHWTLCCGNFRVNNSKPVILMGPLKVNGFSNQNGGVFINVQMWKFN